jgi:hypothetical protein
VVDTENPYFIPAIVNRTWAHFFGRGIVNPVDDFQDKNKPSHPELTQALRDCPELSRSFSAHLQQDRVISVWNHSTSLLHLTHIFTLF